jgi:hypothetical protein
MTRACSQSYWIYVIKSSSAVTILNLFCREFSRVHLNRSAVNAKNMHLVAINVLKKSLVVFLPTILLCSCSSCQRLLY